MEGRAAAVYGATCLDERRPFAARAAGLAAAEDIPGSAAPWSPPRQLRAAPPCMARHRHLAAPGK